MSKYHPFFEDIADSIDAISHPKAQALARAIRTCNNVDEAILNKIFAVARAVLV